jgi:hypothetical protein
MRQLTRQEREHWKASFEVRQTPAELLVNWTRLHEILGPEALIQAGLEFYRDAYVAVRFAKARNADFVRLWPGNRPDFEIVVGGKSLLLEAIEADTPGRKRGAEYKG